MVNMARGCLTCLEEEEEGKGGRREDAQARPRSGAVVMIGPCENDNITLWAGMPMQINWHVWEASKQTHRQTPVEPFTRRANEMREHRSTFDVRLRDRRAFPTKSSC